ncbi:DUF5704 domain-containing protein [Clostridiaceae bacterium HSG29]|nr:DUF5704 domain-containing protein [Clostridiaceae bacterium HSG29]
MIRKIFLIVFLLIVISNFTFSIELNIVIPDNNETIENIEFLKKIIEAENSINELFGINEPFYSNLDSRDDGILEINEIRKIDLFNRFSNKINSNLFIDLNKELFENKKIFAYSDAEDLNTSIFKNIYDTNKFKGNNFKDGEYRYSGINFLGERVVNPDYSYDTDGVSGIDGRQLNDKIWIEEPWKKEEVKESNPDIAPTSFDFTAVKNSNPELIDLLMDEFLLSMEEEHGDYFDGSLVNEEEWLKYIHVTTPYSAVSRGMARLWHNANNTLWYIDVALNNDIVNAIVEEMNTEVTVKHIRYKDGSVFQEETLFFNEINDRISNITLTNYEYIGSQVVYNDEIKEFKTENADMRNYYEISDLDNSKNRITIEFYYKENINEEEVIGEIQAMDREINEFDVYKGIPSSEKLYVNVFGYEYLTDYNFSNIKASSDYEIKIKRKYIEKWIENEEEKTDETTITKTYTISRNYSYYEINNFECYGIDSALIENETLNDGEIEIYPSNYSFPVIDVKNNDNIVSIPQYDSIITLGTKEVDKGEVPSSVNWKDYAEEAVGNYIVKNDKLIFNGNTIMNDNEFISNCPSPILVPEADIVNENVLYKNDLLIDSSIRNGDYSSTGKIKYKRLESLNPKQGINIEKEIDINDVTVHTPIYTELLLSTIGDEFNQNINAKLEDNSIILGMDTTLRYSTKGQHKNILGYGNKEYDKYIKKKEIKFPFDIYFDTKIDDLDKFIEKNTWIEVLKKDTDIYVPIWVDEGLYTMETRTTAINANKNDESILVKANLNKDEYIIKDEKEVEIIGRLYGFKITDIADYPTWEEVFRKEKGSYEHLDGHFYPIGSNDENGNEIKTNEKYFLPIIPGSHPIYENAGSIKTGYEIRFQIETIGNYFNDGDKIIITPIFSYFDKNGIENNNISLWSLVADKDNNSYLIDLNNIKEELKDKFKYEIEVGNPYRDIKEKEYEKTSEIYNITEYELKTKKVNIGYADKINLTKYLRIFNEYEKELPNTINKTRVEIAKQKWYGEYKLPNNTYVIDNDIDLNEYAKDNNGIDFTEDVFKKDGYILVNFQIETEKDANSLGNNLKYNAPLSNMFEIEGFNKTKECNVDGEIKNFNFEYGDIIFFNPNEKRSDDYNSYGTH